VNKYAEYQRAYGKRPEVRAHKRQMARWKVSKLYVDHDKITGQRRGLLCSKCNLAIGGLQHSKELLLAAIEYLETYTVRVVQ
jgi:Recombination endonuclease VII